MKKKKRIGVYGGTFNPIHNGHIAIAQTMISKGIVDEVWLLISPLNPFKVDATDILPDEERLQLARLALADIPSVVASDYEFHLPRPSYTWNTLQSLSKDYPDCQFVLLIGADNWQAFDRWSHYQDILNHYSIVVYPRRDVDVDEAAMPQGVCLLDMPLIDLSSTAIRRSIRNRRTIRGMVPTQIETLCRNVYNNLFKQL